MEFMNIAGLICFKGLGECAGIINDNYSRNYIDLWSIIFNDSLRSPNEKEIRKKA